MATLFDSVSPAHTRILITGASSGLGQAVALALAEAGYRVAIHGRSVDRVAHVRALLERRFGCQVDAYVADLASLRQVDDLAFTGASASAGIRPGRAPSAARLDRRDCQRLTH